MAHEEFTVTVVAGTPTQVSSVPANVRSIRFHARAAFDEATGKGNKGNVYAGKSATANQISGILTTTNGREITPGSSFGYDFGDGSEKLTSFFFEGETSGDLIDISIITR